jgi:hypothetical protein
MRERLIKVVSLNPREWEHLPQLLRSKKELFKGKFLLLPAPDPARQRLLEEEGIGYIIENGECFKPQREGGPQPVERPEGEERGERIPEWCQWEVVDRIVRSGQEIITDKSLILTQRVNGGARIVAGGSVIALEEFEGELIGNGPFLIVCKPKGSIIFGGEEIEPKGRTILVLENGKRILL